MGPYAGTCVYLRAVGPYVCLRVGLDAGTCVYAWAVGPRCETCVHARAVGPYVWPLGVGPYVWRLGVGPYAGTCYVRGPVVLRTATPARVPLLSARVPLSSR